MGKGPSTGQGVGILEEEAQPPHPGVLRVPPTNGTPSPGLSVGGKWLVIWDEWEGIVVKRYDTYEEAAQIFHTMRGYGAVHLAHLIESTE